LHGKAPISLDSSDHEQVASFIGKLGEAITQDMSEIRETTLDQMGSYRSVKLHFTNRVECATVLVDPFGRVVVPVDPQWEGLEAISIEGNEPRAVVRQETRYKGEVPSLQVIYLDKE